MASAPMALTAKGWPAPFEVRRHGSAWLLAAGMLLQLAGGTINTPHFSATLGVYLAAVVFAPKRWPSLGVIIPVWLIVGSACIAAFGATLQPEAITSLALLLVMVPLATVQFGDALERPFAAVVALVAVSVLFQAWQTGWDGNRLAGFATNPNHAAGLLVLCSAFLLRTRYWWLIIPSAAALLLTGSRLGLLVLGVVVLINAVLEQSPGRRVILLLTLAGLGCAMVALTHFLRTGLSWQDIAIRLDIKHVWALWPEGPIARRFSVGVTHSVPLLVLQELGLVAALAWCFASLRPLWTLSRHSPYFWGALAVLGLSLLDTYTWLGAMMAPWWLFVAARERA